MVFSESFSCDRKRMQMKKAVQLLLKALSNPETRLDVQKSRRLMNLKLIDPFRPFYRTLDAGISCGGKKIPVRIYFPGEEVYDAVDIDKVLEEAGGSGGSVRSGEICGPVILYFHGGGFVTESVESYNRVCWNLARHTGQTVISVDYPLAPEHRFPEPFDACYAVAKALYTDRSVFHVNPEDLTIMGDSAGGNLAAAVCQKARDTGDFSPRRQILVYPCVNNNYEENNGFASVMENGDEYLLTRRNMADYLEYYQGSKEDRENPYFAPLMASDYSMLPRALVITGEFDPLRDEGEEYAKRMQEADVEVVTRRIKDGVHGFFLLEPLYPAVREVYQLVNEFLSF